MEALCAVSTVLGIIVDEKNGSGVRHDNHLFRKMAWIAPLPGPLSREPLAYAPTKAPVNRGRSGAWSHFAAYVVQASDQAVDILSHGSEERDRTRSVLNVCEHLMYIFTMARMHRSALMRVFCNLLTPSEN
jgi:hypothetical protein